MNTKIMLLVTGLIAVAAITASTMIATPVYAPSGCMGCSFAPGQQEGAAQNSGPGHLFGGGGQPGASLNAYDSTNRVMHNFLVFKAVHVSNAYTKLLMNCTTWNTYLNVYYIIEPTKRLQGFSFRQLFTNKLAINF